MWDLPGPGLEPESPALAGGFLTTVPPGKPQHLLLRPSFLPVFRDDQFFPEFRLIFFSGYSIILLLLRFFFFFFY